MLFLDALARVLLPYISAQGSEASLPRDLALSLWAGIGAFVQSARARSRRFPLGRERVSACRGRYGGCNSLAGKLTNGDFPM